MTNNIQSDEVRASLLIKWLETLNQGLVKPHIRQDDHGDCCNPSFVIRDTKDFKEHISSINTELKTILISRR